MKRITLVFLGLLALNGCENIYSPININLLSGRVESESTGCTYDDQEVIVDFKKNFMIFASKTYSNFGTPPTSVSTRDESDFVVLNRRNLRLTFENNNSREIYQCYENKI